MHQILCGYRTSVLGVIVLVLAALSWPANAQEVWFAPPDDLPRGTKLFNEDFPRLWTSPQDWTFTASHISTFGLNPYYAAVGPEDKLKAMTSFLASRRIGLAVGMQSLPVEGCGGNIEGMTKTGVPGSIARRIKKFGVDVAYFALDEPLFYGSIYNGRQACKYSIREVARRLADTIKDLHSVYPNAKIVQYEPPTGQSLTEWTATLETWLDSYRAETGTPLDAMGMDSSWQKPWQGTDRATIKILHQRGIKAGIFLDATGGSTVTDESWVANAHKNIAAVQAAKLDLDFVIVASWMLHPWRNLPEGDPSALSALVPWYINHRTEPPR